MGRHLVQCGPQTNSSTAYWQSGTLDAMVCRIVYWKINWMTICHMQQMACEFDRKLFQIATTLQMECHTDDQTAAASSDAGEVLGPHREFTCSRRNYQQKRSAKGVLYSKQDAIHGGRPEWNINNFGDGQRKRMNWIWKTSRVEGISLEYFSNGNGIYRDLFKNK